MLNPDFRDMLSAFAAEKVEFLVVGAYALTRGRSAWSPPSMAWKSPS
jgi:hypothetical protein